MIIRRFATSQQLITQPAHAALAARIMRQWGHGSLPDSPRKASILNAVEQHDSGWSEIDETLVLDGTSGNLVDFIDVSDALKRETSSRGLESLSSDPYAAALVAQHRLHVYRRYRDHPEWDAFFAAMADARDTCLGRADSSLDQLLDDYRFVRAGDLASLAFCNDWKDTADDGCGYAMHLDGTTLLIGPDPFAGRTIAIDIDAREIVNRPFASAAEARRVVVSAPTVRLKGLVKGRDALAGAVGSS